MEKNYLSIKKVNLDLNERKALFLISSKKTISLKELQKFFCGYAISANVLSKLCEHGFISEVKEDKYKVNITKEEYDKYFKEDVEYFGEVDELFHECAEFALENGKVSINSIMKRFSVGIARANLLLDQLEDKGIIENGVGEKTRKVIMTKEEYERFFKKIDK